MSVFSPISRLSFPSRPPEHVVAFGADMRPVLRWKDLWENAAAVAAHAEASPFGQWVLCTESVHRFLAGFLGLLLAGKEIDLPANMQPASLAEAGGSGAGFLDESAIAALEGRSGGASRQFAAVDPSRAAVRFHTSGSSGAPKIVPKRLSQLEAEFANLHAVWGADLEGHAFYSTVSHQHIYGFLFAVMLPFCMGEAIASTRIPDPDALRRLQGGAAAFVLTPAFLKRLIRDRTEPYAFAAPPVVFSAGGVLPTPVAEASERLFGVRLREAYGSTETGGIAYRMGGEAVPWKCFPGVSIRIAEDSGIEVQSPYLLDDRYVATGDTGRLVAPGTFILTGRLDSIVKIEEKRVALSEVENRLRESPLVEDAYVLALEQSRQFLAAVIVLSGEGRALLASSGRRDVTAGLRRHLLAWFEPVIVPRKWRYQDAIPRDTQGKAVRDTIVRLFDTVDAAARSHMPEPTLVENDGKRLTVHLAFPDESVYFDGHFPGFHVLPGVVQVDCAMRLAREHLGVTAAVEEIERLKFSRPIFPGVPLRVEILLDAGKSGMRFRYLHHETGEVFSSGKLRLEKAQ